MAKAIHISTLRKMLQAGDPVDISLWKSNGEILHYRNAVPLRYDFYKGTRRIKLLDSRECCRQVSKSINKFCFYNERKQFRRSQIHTVRDVCIFEINGMEVFL